MGVGSGERLQLGEGRRLLWWALEGSGQRRGLSASAGLAASSPPSGEGEALIPFPGPTPHTDIIKACRCNTFLWPTGRGQEAGRVRG